MTPNATSRTAVLRDVYDRLADRAAAASLEGMTDGDRQVLVEVHHPRSGRTAGVAIRPEGEAPEGASTVRQQARLAFDDRLGHRAVGIATLNALSAPDIAWRQGDPMDLVPDGIPSIATVGLFWRAFEKIDAPEIRVVERDPASVEGTPEHVTVYGPDEAATAFDGAAVCFLTGSTLVYGGLERYLGVLEQVDDPIVVLIGATASMLPEPLFSAGVDVVAGARVTDSPTVRARIADDDCGTDLHEAGLEKVYVTPSGREPFANGGSFA